MKETKEINIAINFLIGLIILVLASCGDAPAPSPTNSPSDDNEVETPALFGSSDLSNAKQVSQTSLIEILGIELNNDESGTELPFNEEDESESELSTQKVLSDAEGWLVLYRTNASGTYQIRLHDQTNNSNITTVYSDTDAVQSVAVNGDGTNVVASMINPTNGKYDIYLFDLPNNQSYNLSNTSSIDELDVSITRDAHKIAWQGEESGKKRPFICDYDASGYSCTISSLINNNYDQIQPSLSAKGDYLALVRLLSGNRYQVRLYGFSGNSYTNIRTRTNVLSHPSVDEAAKKIMYLLQLSSINRNFVRIKDLGNNTFATELKNRLSIGHPFITANTNFLTYEQFFNSRSMQYVITRNIHSNDRVTTQGGNWNYYQPFWMGPETPSRLYVDVTANAGGNGTSWSNAFNSLQDALAAWDPLIHTDGIWVAKGVYYPDEGTGITPDDRNASFNLEEGMKVYGGFAGGESDLSARNPSTNVTVLSGDIDSNDANKDSNGVTPDADDIQGSNSYHVVLGDGTNTAITNVTMLDGFTITGGLATGSSPNNLGGGMYCNGRNSGSECSPILTNISFLGNRANSGGAMSSDGDSSGKSSPILTHVIFSGNKATVNGGGMFNNGFAGTSNPTLTNVTFATNHATNGGAMYIDGTFGTNNSNIQNTIFWGNTATTNPEIFSDTATPTISYSLFEGAAPSGTGNIQGSSSPFISTTDLQLKACSEAIDAGNNSVNSESTDLAGNTRKVDDTDVTDVSGQAAPVIDVGAYERQDISGSCPTVSLVKDINLGSVGSDPKELAVFNSRLYFQANDGTNGWELWEYDDTNDPSLVKDIRSGFNSSAPHQLTVFNGKLYFAAADSTNGFELWVYDGINDPSLVKDIWNGSISSRPSGFTEFNNKLYFRADNDTSGYELWVYDGINDPSLVKDIWTGPNDSSPTFLTVFNNKLYFAANGWNSGNELWVYDGINDPSLVKDINPGSSGSFPIDLTVFNNKLYFQADHDTNGDELWVYDGSNDPSLAKDIWIGPSGSDPRELIVFNSKLYFRANTGTNGFELWEYDGINDPSLVKDIWIGGSSTPNNLKVFNNKLYFSAQDGTNGLELWEYDGINDPSLIKDILIGPSGSGPRELTAFNNKLYFQADDGISGKELWVFTP